ncbi:MAG: alpha/beta hydrolase [Pseudomonadota bacterium]
MKFIVALLLTLVLAGVMIYFWFPDWLIESGIRALRWWVGLKRYEVQVDDHRWVYLEGGKGEPILFLHGFGADKDRWGPFLKTFRGSYRVIAPDLPGFGENSRVASAGYDIPSQVQRLDCFVETIGLDSFHLVGISMGGYISGYYAGEYPEKVKSLVLIAPAGVKSEIPSHVWQRYQKEGKNVLLYQTPTQFEELVSVVTHRPPWVPGVVKKYFSKKGAVNYNFNKKILQGIVNGGQNLLESRLPKIKAKTLIIWGRDDRVINVSSVKNFEAGLKDSRTVIIEDCGHVPYFEKPEETKRAYREFLASLH